MSFSYNSCDGTNDQVDFVRLLISDTADLNHVFEDSEILAFYAIQASVWQTSMFYSGAGGRYLPSSPVSYLRVAALALDSIASNQSKLAGITKLLDVNLDSAKGADAMRAQASEYRQIDDESGAIAVIEQCSTQWSFVQRYWSQVQRQSAA